MLKNLTYYLILITSLLLASTSQQTFAADKSVALPTKVQSISKISINKATDKELASINGIGAKKAQSIVEYRKANGKFSTLDDLIKVKGVGEATLKKIKPFISL